VPIRDIILLASSLPSALVCRSSGVCVSWPLPQLAGLLPVSI